MISIFRDVLKILTFRRLGLAFKKICLLEETRLIFITELLFKIFNIVATQVVYVDLRFIPLTSPNQRIRDCVFRGIAVQGGERGLLHLIPESNLGLCFSVNDFGYSGRKRIKALINFYLESYRNNGQAGFPATGTPALCLTKKQKQTNTKSPLQKYQAGPVLERAPSSSSTKRCVTAAVQGRQWRGKAKGSWVLEATRERGYMPAVWGSEAEFAKPEAGRFRPGTVPPHQHTHRGVPSCGEKPGGGAALGCRWAVGGAPTSQGPRWKRNPQFRRED